MTSVILFCILGYVAGSIPFSYIIPTLFGKDIRKVGSGNVGGTNVLRTLGFLPGFISIMLDIFKAFIPVFVAKIFYGNISWIPYLTAFFAIIGHDYPIWLKFKGGKGVASTAGVMFGLSGISGLIFVMIWIPITLVTKYVSVASISALILSSIFSFFYDFKLGILMVILAIIGTYKHKDNIIRLLNGNENKTDIFKIFKKGIKK
ncbi:glycerol-3-phosphate acyltransferase 2 [Tepiditoga spiralis]|uniref:Glycerol-3-phosphate acyltransferase n=1 Tax=Tepiditoga spiralis TaxID=2108365 RepID=A0A7G1G8T7_9BACT|nr:glycerol-3-phosphate acyltransferase 2 [Tepiditoga spiralis]